MIAAASSLRKLTTQSSECIELLDSDSDEAQPYQTPLRSLSRTAPSASAAPPPLDLKPYRQSSVSRQRPSPDIVSISDVIPPSRRRVIQISDEDSAEERAKLFSSSHRKAAHILGLDVCRRIIREFLFVAELIARPQAENRRQDCARRQRRAQHDLAVGRDGRRR